MAYNLLGQQGPKGSRNPDPSLSDAEATYLYDNPPGSGDNKGLDSRGNPVDTKDVQEKLDDNEPIRFTDGPDEGPRGFREPRQREGRTLAEILRQNTVREYTEEEWDRLKSAPLDEKLKVIEENSRNGIRLTGSQKYFLNTNYNISPSDTNKAQDKGKEVVVPESGPLKPGDAGYGIDTWYEFLGYGSEDDAMRDFVKGDLTRAEIRRAENEIQPDPADIMVDTKKVADFYGFADSDFARTAPGQEVKKFLSLLDTIDSLENSDYGKTPPGQDVINDLKKGAKGNITVTGNNSGELNLNNNNTTGEFLNTDSVNLEGGDDGGDGGGPPSGGPQTPTPGRNINSNKNQFNNIPEGADLVEVEGQLYLRYAVPGAGELYQGSTIFLYYTVKDNDPIKAGFVTPGADYFINAILTSEDLDLTGLVAGNSADLPGNDPRTGRAPHPFTSFAETLAQEATIQPWLLDPDSVALIAEAALEDREVTVAEWAGTNWYKTHTDTERDWLLFYHRDPISANQKANDYKIQIASALRAAGVSGGYDSETNQELAAPDALSQWIANKWVTGQWSESYTTEQLALFADPFRSGTRDADFTTYISTAGLGGLNRSAEQEDRIRQLYTQYLGPVFGKLTDAETAEKAGRLRNNPDYESALIESLKTSRVAIFPKYTNPELTYDDIAAPWRGLTRQTWGQEADETQGWWQDMVASNNYEEGQQLLRTKGLEQDITKVNIEATQALTDALGGAAGSVESSFGVNQ
jgi:hypothetical protein